jgi:hypothetical protein
VSNLKILNFVTKEDTKMNKEALTKHEIYNKLFGFTEHDLNAIANFIDFMRHKKKLEAKKVFKLEGILKGYDIDFADLKKFKQKTWKHVDQEFGNG